MTTLLTSCQTTQKVELEWTLFPSPIVNGENVVKFDLETKTVSMPLWYWKQITNYVIDTETNIEIIEKMGK